jgi:glycopeptide antibiotics resistance protein
MLRWPRLHPFWVVIMGFAVSATIEAAQLTVLTGRDASLNDIALNTAGTALGWVAGRTLADLVLWVRDPDPYGRAGKFSE